MIRWIIPLIIIVPVIEVWGILQVGDWLGGWNTFLILIAISLAGAYLAQSEGRKVWANAQRELQAGQMPGRSIIDGICVFAGGLLLMVPGFFTDIFGVVLLLPPTRPLVRGLILQWLEKVLKNGQFTIRRF